jgi:hypothetical protein
MVCLFCGSAALAPLYEGIRDHYGVDPGIRRFLRCRDCGSAILDPLPSPEDLTALYSSDYTFKPAPGRSTLRRSCRGSSGNASTSPVIVAGWPSSAS